MHDAFGIAPDTEITMESAPDAIPAAKLSALRQLGVNRLSFRPELLDEPAAFVPAGQSADGRLAASSVASRSPQVVGFSDAFALDGDPDAAWPFVLDAVNRLFPTLLVVGYEQGDDLAAATRHGFEPVGPLRIWGTASKAADQPGSARLGSVGPRPAQSRGSYGRRALSPGYRRRTATASTPGCRPRWSATAHRPDPQVSRIPSGQRMVGRDSKDPVLREARGSAGQVVPDTAVVRFEVVTEAAAQTGEGHKPARAREQRRSGRLRQRSEGRLGQRKPPLCGYAPGVPPQYSIM
ncbi:hypothetical protein ACIRPT_06790 [Streptomyces sp. NPDC101227]|uniref:hypothetical protein n=1 Tax=Streptomyces sp. NPDC101227 TaxID=3366136 RepID=UPI00383057F5